MQPASFAHPSRIVQCFDGRIGEDVALRLRGEERFRERLSGLVTRTYALSPDLGDLDSAQDALLRAAIEGRLDSLLRLAGAIYWARAIVTQIEASAVLAIRQAIGDDAHAAAIAHRDLSGSDPDLPAPDALAAAVTVAGARCLSAWCAQQPAALAQRLRLALPGSAALDAPAPPPFDTAGPRIIDRLAT